MAWDLRLSELSAVKTDRNCTADCAEGDRWKKRSQSVRLIGILIPFVLFEPLVAIQTQVATEGTARLRQSYGEAQKEADGLTTDCSDNTDEQRRSHP